ncbi:MAG: hypothetical protein ACOC56_02255 [Atribacterota bacterium]
MKKQIYSYALIKSFYDKGEDYIDSFWPFAVKIFPSEKTFLSLDTIQTKIKKDFEIKIPLHTLKTILKKAKKKGYLDQKKERYILKDTGLKYQSKLETDKEVDRRITSLFIDIKEYLNQQGIIKSKSQIESNFLFFVRKNISSIVECFNPSLASSKPKIKKATIFERQLIEYIDLADKQKPEHYKTLQDIILGSIISTILSTQEATEIMEIKKRKFKNSKVILDTSFIFSLLRLSRQQFYEPAKELFDLLKKYEFKIKIYSFTVDEICRVINGYARDGYRYPVNIRIDDSLYSSLKRKGWKKSDAKEFIMNIEDTLSSSGIHIELVKDIDLENYNPKDNKLRNKMRRHKPDQGLFFQNHDLAALERTKQLRREPVRKIEDARVFFLTSDKRLSKFNLYEMGHRENGTMCEVILDSLITTILWLKDPSAKVSLKSLIGIHSRDLFVKRRIWEQFYETIKKLKQEKKVKEEAISMLFYDNYIEDVLSEFDDTEKDEITPEFVLEEIEKASKLPEKKVKRIVKEKEKEFLNRLEEEISKKAQEKDEEWLKKQNKIKEKVLKSAEKSSNYKSLFYTSILSITILIVMLCIYLMLNKWGIPHILSWLIPFFFGGSGIGGIWTKLRKHFKKTLLNSIYIKKLREIGLDGVEEETS